MIEIKIAIENLKHLEESLDEYSGLNRGGKETFDLAIAALKKQEAIKFCTPPSDDWEHYADRLHDIAYQSGYEQGKKDAEQDRWIPVTERLPKPNTNVIMQCRAKGYNGKYRYFQTIGCYIPALTVKSEEKWNDDCEGVEIYDEKTDSFYCKEGWYEESTQGDGDYMSWYMGANVIAWRPLPETYTEETS